MNLQKSRKVIFYLTDKLSNKVLNNLYIIRRHLKNIIKKLYIGLFFNLKTVGENIGEFVRN